MHDEIFTSRLKVAENKKWADVRRVEHFDLILEEILIWSQENAWPATPSCQVAEAAGQTFRVEVGGIPENSQVLRFVNFSRVRIGLRSTSLQSAAAVRWDKLVRNNLNGAVTATIDVEYNSSIWNIERIWWADSTVRCARFQGLLRQDKESPAAVDPNRSI